MRKQIAYNYCIKHSTYKSKARFYLKNPTKTAGKMKLKTFTLLVATMLCAIFMRAQTVSFTISQKTGCAPLAGVLFTNTSTGGGGVASQTWNFDNGVTSTLNPAGTNFINARPYYVTLTVTFNNGSILSKTDTVIAHPKPIANFTATDTLTCLNTAVTFTSTSTTATGTITNYQWDFGNGSTNATTPTINNTYTINGSYQVQLIVTSNWGCTSNAATKPNFVTVYTKPQAYIYQSSYGNCKDTGTITFTNGTYNISTTPASVLRYRWLFGPTDSLVATTPPPKYFASKGYREIQLKASIGNGCSTTYTSSLSFGAPDIQFLNAPDTVCLGTPTAFTTRNTDRELFRYPEYNYTYWQFTDPPAVSTTTFLYNNPNGTHTFNRTFNTPGNYLVRAMSYDYYHDCRDTVIRPIYVKSFLPSFTTSNDTAYCAPPADSITFTNTTIGSNLRFTWNFGDGSPTKIVNGQQAVKHKYNTYGDFNVTLTAVDTVLTGSCTSTFTKQNYIRIHRPYFYFTMSPQGGCTPLPVKLRPYIYYNLLPTLPYTYTWTIRQGSTVLATIVRPTADTPTYVFTTAGVYNVTLTMNGPNCSYSYGPVNITAGNTCQDTGGGLGGGGGGGNFSTLRNCTNKYSITFNDTTVNTVPNRVITAWNFGDGTVVNTGVLNPITHTYMPPQKVYTVKVYYLNTLTNVTDSSFKIVRIVDEKANFYSNVTNTCKDRYVYFNTNIFGIDSTLIKKYEWNFGRPDASYQQTINAEQFYLTNNYFITGYTYFYYRDTGTYRVKLKITDVNNCVDSIEKTIVIASPEANFSGDPLAVCGNVNTVLFRDSSVKNGNVPITRWYWDFGDYDVRDFNSRRDTFTKVFTDQYSYAYRTYYARLTITDSLGCTSTKLVYDYVKKYKPKANIYDGYDSVRCNNYSIYLYNFGTNARNGINQWYIGDTGTIVRSTNYYYNASFPVTSNDTAYTIKLKVTDEFGCVDSMVRPNYVRIIKPKALISIRDTSGCAPITVKLADSSRYARSWSWDFGNGSAGSTSQHPLGAPISKIYGIPGSYTVRLAIVGPDGCKDTAYMPLRVRGVLANLITPASSGCKPYTHNMQVTGTNIINYVWDYADGTPPTGNPTQANVSHTYTEAGLYNPNVIVTNTEGCTVALVAPDPVKVDSLKINFTQNKTSICVNDPVLLTGTGQHPSFSSVTKYIWNFGGGVLDSINNPTTKSYTSAGQYSITCTGVSQFGCRDTITKINTILVEDRPNATAYVDTARFCLSTVVQVRARIISPLNTYVYYTWDKQTPGSSVWVPTGHNDVGVPTWDGTAYTYIARYPTYPGTAADDGVKYRVRVATTPTYLSNECAGIANGIVPVKLFACNVLNATQNVLLTGIKTNGQHILQWQAKLPTIYSYQPEYSFTGTNYQPIGNQINFANSQAYKFSSAVHFNTATYYRVKIINTITNEFTYTNSVYLTNTSSSNFTVRLLTNPITNAIAPLDVLLPQAANTQFNLYATNGSSILNQVKALAKGSNLINFMLPNTLAKGFYVLRITANGQVQTIKLQVQ
jgi:PKD repeat protein